MIWLTTAPVGPPAWPRGFPAIRIAWPGLLRQKGGLILAYDAAGLTFRAANTRVVGKLQHGHLGAAVARQQSEVLQNDDAKYIAGAGWRIGGESCKRVTMPMRQFPP